MYQRILVATDGAPGALGAIRLAELVQARQGSNVQVFSACDPGDFYRMPVSDRPGEAPPQLPRTALDAVHQRVLKQLSQAGVDSFNWPVTVERGAPASAVSRFAARRGSELILVGLPPAPLGVECWIGRETIQRLIQLAHVPVVAVPAGVRELPSRALVALDFSRFSTRAAWEVARLVDPGADVHLAHVLAEPVEDGENWDRDLEWATRYRPNVQRRLDDMAGALQGVADIRTHLHTLHGEPAHALFQLGEEIDADLVALGSHGQGFLGRLATGSTTSRLLRGAESSLLVVPPSGVPSELLRGGRTVGSTVLPNERVRRGSLEPLA